LIIFLQRQKAKIVKENEYNFKELTDDQRRIFIDTLQLHEAYLNAREKALSYAGGMYWKKSKERQYLFRRVDRLGRGKSLGRRSPETERILNEFRSGKSRAKERLDATSGKLKTQARVCKAVGIQRVPRVVAEISRLLERVGMLGRSVIIVGTNALYAYEAAAGVFFDPSVTATTDMDLLWDTRSKLTLSGDRSITKTGLIKILQKADRSFELPRKGGFRAINKDGYMVDLIKPVPKPPWKEEPRRMGDHDDLVAAEVLNLQWLLASPKFTQVVIGADGFPAPMVVPDPRAFVLHKLWLSQQDDREPTKKPRDNAQALAVASLILRYLPQYEFHPSELKMFPMDVVKRAEDLIDKQKLPASFDDEV
jgi:hypothetical protein